MDRIPKIFVINLPHRTDRLKSISAELDRMGLLDKMEIVEGVILPARDGTGTLGITIAHSRCLEIAKERGYEMIMILQDDCKFLVNKDTFHSEIETFLKTAPEDWNGLWFGSVTGNDYIKAESNWMFGAGFNQDTATLIHSRFYSELIDMYHLCRDKFIETEDHKYEIDSWVATTVKIYNLQNKICGQADNFSDRVFLNMCGGIGVPL